MLWHQGHHRVNSRYSKRSQNFTNINSKRISVSILIFIYRYNIIIIYNLSFIQMSVKIIKYHDVGNMSNECKNIFTK